MQIQARIGVVALLIPKGKVSGTVSQPFFLLQVGLTKKIIKHGLWGRLADECPQGARGRPPFLFGPVDGHQFHRQAHGRAHPFQ